MKTKGISFVEEHVEKFVLGAVGVVFFSVLVWQLFPTTVKVEGKEVPLSLVDKELEAKTASLNLKLDQPREPLAKQLEGKLKAQLTAFNAELASGVSPSAALPRIEPILAADLNVSGATSSAMEFNIPKFAPVKMRGATQVDDTIDETVFAAHPQLAQYFASATGPHDISWLVPSAQIDLKSMLTALKDSNPKAALIPGHWYDNNLFLIDVNFNREEQLPDGSFGNAHLVDVLPGAFTLRSEIEKNPDAGLRDSVWTSLRDKATQRAILQPDFLKTKRSNFSAADLLTEQSAAGEGEDPVIRGLRKAVAKAQLEVTRITADLQELGGPLEDTSKEDKRKEEERKKKEQEEAAGGGNNGGGGGASRPGGGLGGGGGGGGLGGGGLGGGMGGKNTGGGDPKDTATKDKRIKMTKVLKEKTKKLEALQKQLNDKDAAAAATKASAAAANDLAAAEKAVIWAHDLGVVAGKTYRYQAVVKTYNPFFTNTGVLPDSQKAEGAAFTRTTPISGWSEPCTVAPRIAFFVTDAVPGEGRLGVGQATVEVFCYRDGERRSEKFTVQPGDTIGAGKSKGDAAFDTGYYVVDIVSDPITERTGADRRPSATVVVQSAEGKTFQIRVPKADSINPTRRSFQDEIEMAKADDAAEKAAGTKNGDAADASTPTPPKG